LKGPKTGSGKTELHILSAASNYQNWALQTGTALEYTDENWAFTMKSNNDLVCIKKGPTTGSGKTEVHILSAASNYKSWALQTGTVLGYADENWAFTMKSNDDLVGILKGPKTGSGKTELHIASASSNYQEWALQTGTGMGYTSLLQSRPRLPCPLAEGLRKRTATSRAEDATSRIPELETAR